MMTDQATLIGESLVLRPLQASDTGMITLYASEEKLARMTTSIPHPLPPGAAEAFVERSTGPDADERVWAMMPKGASSDELVGLISISDENELGYWVGSPFRNTGYATEAVILLVSHLFKTGVPAVEAHVFQDNPTSARVLTKAGFAYVGDGQTHSVARGARVDRWHYRLERLAWAAE